MEALFRLAIGLGLLVGLSLFAKDVVLDQTGLRRDSATAAATSSSCSPDAGILALVATNEVQSELAIDTSQKQMIDELIASVREASVAHASNMDEACERSGVQMVFDDWSNCATAFQTKNLKIVEVQLQEILNPEQWSRLEQLQRQREGIRAFGRPDVIVALQLTNEQLERINELPVIGFFSSAPPEHRSSLRKSLIGILTESQWSEWSSLRGNEFTFNEFVGIDQLFIGRIKKLCPSAKSVISRVQEP